MEEVKEKERMEAQAGAVVAEGLGQESGNLVAGALEQAGAESSEGIAEVPGGLKYFTTAQALQALRPEFLHEGYCRDWVIETLHPCPPICPQCKTVIADPVTLFNFFQSRRCKCKHCGKWFTAHKGTFLDEGHLTEKEVFLLAVLIELKLHKDEIAKALNINPATVHSWKKKFKALEELV